MRLFQNIFILFPWFFSILSTGGNPVINLNISEKSDYFTLIDSVPVNIIHQSLHLSIDPRIRFIEGKVETSFTSLDTPLHEFCINLHSDLHIDSVLNIDGNLLNFNRKDLYTVAISLESPVLQGQTTTISIFYHGVPPENGFGSFVQSAHATDSIIWTLSEPYGARDWWPCGQNLEDKIDSLDLWIMVPAGHRAAGNGLLLSEKPVTGNKVLFHWQHRYPIANYLVAFAVTNYEVYTFEIELANGPLPIVNYLYPQDYDRHSTKIESILPAMMKLYEELFIPYPFSEEKYGHAQFGFGGGMEHQTMSFMGGFSYTLTAHELAHQWFGDYVTCGSWRDIWLNEGFATYLTGLTYEKILKNGSWENFLISSIKEITSAPGGSLLVTDTLDFKRIFNSRLSYQKGAMVLHMLRWILGDENFFEGVRQYLLDEETQYSFARTHHLVANLESVSGIDLDEFFRDWYEGEGYPSYHLQWQKTDTTLVVKVNQTASHPSVTFFELPVEVGLYGPQSDTLIRLDVSENGQVFNLNLQMAVDSIAIDPHHWIVSAGNSTEISTGIRNPGNAGSYRIYPNPANWIFQIENNGDETIQSFFVYNLLGQIVYSSHHPVFKDTSDEVDLSGQAPGLYFLVLKSADGSVATKKIIIQ